MASRAPLANRRPIGYVASSEKPPRRFRSSLSVWHRRRAQLNFDVFMASPGGGSTINWTPDQIKHHDLALRYKNSAERSSQRAFRLLEQFYKAHCPKPAQEPAPKEEQANGGLGPTVVFTVEDPTSPTGYRELQRCAPQPPLATGTVPSSAPTAMARSAGSLAGKASFQAAANLLTPIRSANLTKDGC
jgi:hypothetical protein